MNGNGIYISSLLQLYPLLSADSIAAAQLNAALFGPSEAIVVTEGIEDQLLQDSLMPRDSDGRIPSEAGCAGEIEEKINAPLIDTRDLEAEAYGLTFEHAAVLKKSQEWSACMQQAGFRYETFSDAATANPGTPTPDKIAAAKADVACTTSTQWPSTFYSILSDYEQQIIDRQPDLFQAALAAEKRRLERIDLLIDG